MAAIFNQIRSSVAGSSIGEPSELREVQAGAVREIGASVWTTELAVASFGLRGSSPSPATGRGKAGTFHSGAPS